MRYFKAIFSAIKSTFEPYVLLPALLFIVGTALFSVLFPVKAELFFSDIRTFLLDDMNWFYNWVLAGFVLFLMFLFCSKWGSLKLGPQDSKPSFPFLSWASMILASGLGVGMMYFGTAELVLQYAEPAVNQLPEQQRLKDAQLYTFFHWGIHGWSVYAIVGLCIAYMSYRHKLPLSLRNGLFPFLEDKIHGSVGHIVSVVALCCTFFGIITTLGFGVMQISSGLAHTGVVPGVNAIDQILIILALTLVVVAMALVGSRKSTLFLSYSSLSGAFILFLFILSFGPKRYLLDSFGEGLVSYIKDFFKWTLRSQPSEPARAGWSLDWTLLYWASWICWSPYVGLYLARISRGRTIREFIGTVLLVPALFNFIWMTAFGNTAVWIDQHGAHGEISALVNKPNALLFEILDYFPLATASKVFALCTICLFFLLSLYLGTDALKNLSSSNTKKKPTWQFVMWALVLAFCLSVLLSVGGPKALQTMILIASIPFALTMVLFCCGLVKDIVGKSLKSRREEVDTAS
jgi:choline/glycine/proline betaine transport protein